MRVQIILLCLISFSAVSQTIKEKEMKTEIGQVTVFLKNAQIFETGSVAIAPGKSIIRIKNLSPYLDDKSIQVKATGDFTILSVNHKFNFLSETKRDGQNDSLRNAIETIGQSIVRGNARLEVLAEKQSVLNQNKTMSGTASGVTLAQLKQAMLFYETEVTAIKEEEIKVRLSIARKKDEQKKLEQQLTELNDKASLPGSEIEIRVSAENALTAKFSLSYLVGNAGWYPKYDVRVKDIRHPLELTYKAEVFQNTGVDWKNVKLKFSNGDPNQSGVVPELPAWNLNYARNIMFDPAAIYGSRASGMFNTVRGKIVDESGLPIPGVNVMIKGTTLGTSTDVNGAYSLTLPNGATTLVASFIGYSSQEVAITRPEMNLNLAADVSTLSEVVGYGFVAADKAKSNIRIRGLATGENKSMAMIATRVVENQTTVEIEVEMPYSIKSNGEKLMVDLKRHEIAAGYEYYAIPKLDKDAFLMARIINWDQYNLLEGEANLYFEDAFVGRTILDAKALKDTLNISLGRDKNIVVGRVKNEEFSRRKTIGTNKVESRGFKITVRNKKSQPIKLTIFDQVPLSVISDITVTPIELTKGTLDEKTGKVKWEMSIDPQQQQELSLQYEVKYPKREVLALE